MYRGTAVNSCFMSRVFYVTDGRTKEQEHYDNTKSPATWPWYASKVKARVKRSRKAVWFGAVCGSKAQAHEIHQIYHGWTWLLLQNRFGPQIQQDPLKISSEENSITGPINRNREPPIPTPQKAHKKHTLNSSSFSLSSWSSLWIRNFESRENTAPSSAIV